MTILQYLLDEYGIKYPGNKSFMYEDEKEVEGKEEGDIEVELDILDGGKGSVRTSTAAERLRLDMGRSKLGEIISSRTNIHATGYSSILTYADMCSASDEATLLMDEVQKYFMKGDVEDSNIPWEQIKDTDYKILERRYKVVLCTCMCMCLSL
jgi:hypothetical protein